MFHSCVLLCTDQKHCKEDLGAQKNFRIKRWTVKGKNSGRNLQTWSKNERALCWTIPNRISYTMSPPTMCSVNCYAEEGNLIPLINLDLFCKMSLINCKYVDWRLSIYLSGLVPRSLGEIFLFFHFFVNRCAFELDCYW